MAIVKGAAVPNSNQGTKQATDGLNAGALLAPIVPNADDLERVTTTGWLIRPVVSGK